eukprot:5137766-Prymnesium_polylepis.1
MEPMDARLPRELRTLERRFGAEKESSSEPGGLGAVGGCVRGPTGGVGRRCCGAQTRRRQVRRERMGPGRERMGPAL